MECNLSIQMLLSNPVKVLALLTVIVVEFGHRRVQYSFATCSSCMIGIRLEADWVSMVKQAGRDELSGTYVDILV